MGSWVVFLQIIIWKGSPNASGIVPVSTAGPDRSIGLDYYSNFKCSPPGYYILKL